jgi:hypothetical protein
MRILQKWKEGLLDYVFQKNKIFTYSGHLNGIMNNVINR